MSKPKTKAERVTWMSKTSDIVGSHLRTDLEAYLTLIRRKVQEKCATTHELITHIRRGKIGDSKFVTPNEFRFTLIKFGIIFPQSLVDIVFNVFDSDRSGSMDFDEFAMWIMNSEFKPMLTNAAATKKAVQVDSPDDILRRKLAQFMKESPEVFELMKRKVSFLEFVSEINRKIAKVSEMEARQIFLNLDPNNTGFIDSHHLMHWIRTGSTDMPKTIEAPRSIPTLPTCINIVSGRNSKHMESCFAHISEGSGVKVTFEEFRRCLLQQGLGKNLLDSRDLFMALGGESGVADIDTLFRACKKLHLPGDPKGEVNFKHITPSFVSAGRAARHLRDAMRKVYGDVKAEILSKDPGQTGFILAEDLHAIIVRHGMPMTFQDFRYIVQQLKTEDGGARIDWHSFLNAYNPKKAPHQLNGAKSMSELDLAEASFSGIAEQKSVVVPTKPNPRAIRPLTAAELGRSVPMAGTKSVGLASTWDGSTAQEADSAPSPQKEMKGKWQIALRNCQKSDPDRSGLVNRVSFISSLEAAGLDSSMCAESISKLAGDYTTSAGLIDYVCCFRELLNGLGRSNFLNKNQTSTIPAASSVREAGPSHPWDFQYHRDRRTALPYWGNANTAKDIRLDMIPQPSHVPTMSRSTTAMTTTEKEALLSKFPDKALTACSKCYTAFLPMWKALRNELLRSQITSQRGCIIAEKFQAILEHFGAHLNKAEWAAVIRAFRGTGAQDVVRFDEFLKVCLVAKGNYSHL